MLCKKKGNSSPMHNRLHYKINDKQDYIEKKRDQHMIPEHGCTVNKMADRHISISRLFANGVLVNVLKDSRFPVKQITGEMKRKH